MTTTRTGIERLTVTPNGTNPSVLGSPPRFAPLSVLRLQLTVIDYRLIGHRHKSAKLCDKFSLLS